MLSWKTNTGFYVLLLINIKKFVFEETRLKSIIVTNSTLTECEFKGYRIEGTVVKH